MKSPVGLAIDEAEKSNHSARHGAVVYKNGTIIQSGRNQYCSLERLRHYKSNRIWSIHAEMNALASLPKNVTRGAAIVAKVFWLIQNLVINKTYRNQKGFVLG